MLTPRQTELLRLLVGDYIQTASMVSSTGLVQRHGLSISPATVRNELAELEEGGYLSRPHTSAGVVPTERGYRLYVETVAGDQDLPAAQRWTIRHQFHQVEREEERWMRLAAATLAQAAAALALVTPLRANVSRLRAIELVPLEDNRVLLILVLQDGQVRRQMLHLPQATPAEEAEQTGHRLSALYAGLTRTQIARQEAPDDPLGGLVMEAVFALMAQADAEKGAEPYVYGFSQVLSQPEFVGGGPIRGLLEALDAGRLVPALRLDELSPGELRVTIGEEHGEDFLRPYGVVLAAYGSEGEGQGMVAVLGPMRMAYATAIPSVRYLSQILSELAGETTPGHRRTGLGGPA